MKKTLTYIGILALGALTVASCNLNNYPVFDDNDAFVAFDASSAEFPEPAQGESSIVEVSVTLASVEGLSATVSYDAVDGEDDPTGGTFGAKQGVDFEFVDPAKTLTFDAKNRTQTIQIRLLDTFSGDLVHIGDRTFSLCFVSTGSLNQGAENTMTVRISDGDHPLNPILGTYNMSGESYFNGPITWQMNLVKDDTDMNTVWFENIEGTQNITGFFGTVTIDETTSLPKSISLSIGQQSTMTTSTCLLYGIDADGGLTDVGTINIEITYDAAGVATIEFKDWGPAICADPAAGSYYGIVYPGAKGTKVQ